MTFKYNICVSIVEKTVSDALKAIKKAYKKKADLIELRLDYLKDLNEKNYEKKIKKLLTGKKKPIIVTCRRVQEEGNFKGTEQERYNLLSTAVKYKADFIDLDLKYAVQMLKLLREKNKKSRFILSYHNFQETPDNFELEMTLRKLNVFEPDVIKIFTKANKLNDIVRVFEFVKEPLKFKKKVVFGLIGELGEFSRILAPFYGSEWTFASLEKGKESAEGQLTIQELKETYFVKRFKKKPNILIGIGNPIKQSKGPLIHNNGLWKANINSIMLKLKVTNLLDFKQFFDFFDVQGCSVTMPLKQSIMQLMTKLDSAVEKIQAMNTIVKKGSQLIGYNTDVVGAINALKYSLGKKSLQKKNLLKGKKVALFGAGGAAKAIAFGLKKEKAEVTIINRTLDKAKELGLKYEQNFASLNSLKELSGFDIIVNATSVGMKPNTKQNIVPERFLQKNTIVMDIVYNPLETKLLQIAKKRKCKTISGLEMFIGQAAEQFMLWNKKKLNEKFIRNVLLKELKKDN